MVFVLTSDDHNIIRNEELPEERASQTLSAVLNTLLSTTLQVNGHPMNGREIFETALRALDSGEGSLEISEYLQTLSELNFKTEEGVDDEFLDNLERVDAKLLPENSECPICTSKFADNEYPLLVKLPCRVQNNSKKEHIFDLDCIAPWLKLHSTCPLCRFDVKKVAETRRLRLEEEVRLAREELDPEEEEDWDLYG